LAANSCRRTVTVANWCIKIREETLTASIAFIVAAVVAFGAYALRLLTRGGAIAAAVIGAATLVAGVQWVVILAFFFLSSNALSRWRHAERERLVASITEKGDRRDAVQVMANGGVFAVAAFISSLGGSLHWEAIGIGAIAAATSDTWSTEIGTVLGDGPVSVLNGVPVAPGTSGGITIAGCITAYFASLVVAGVAILVQWSTPWQAVFVGGLTGSALDSLLGATIQERRWCTACDVATERRIHTCGNSSVDRGGVPGCNNDIVNLMSTIAGAVVTWILT
jgi:uncharacterized protein (TIGR00297 family)